MEEELGRERLSGRPQKNESSRPAPAAEAFSEMTGREDLSILEAKINELSLRIEGTALERHILQLHKELLDRGLRFLPRCYLSDEWGCPDGIPVIGIPFYLANPMLSRIEERETGDLEGGAQILKYLRHEAGHAYNYAYRLYETEEWHNAFGPYTRPYRDDYRPAPFSKKFVRHLPGWYAQKHPDEDFAETFAVWVTPGVDWSSQYAGWPALTKLQYVDRAMRALPAADLPADLASLSGLLPVEEMDYTVREHYQRQKRDDVAAEIGQLLDGDLRDLFGSPDGIEGEPAGAWIGRQRRDLVRDIGYWTGERPEVVRALVDHLALRAGSLGLVLPKDRADQMRLRFSIVVTTLVVNHLYRDRFVEL